MGFLYKNDWKITRIIHTVFTKASYGSRRGEMLSAHELPSIQ
ncbi:hypothetical protein QY96_03263 [Bacillus thermotolerans]|nr:hypothetical protein QY96_03263 [Bacillus thermotolerans]